MSILDKIKQANLVGRGGACFPTAVKWEAVKNAPGDKKYVVINCSEGEPGVKKDEYILANYPERVLEGLELARDFLGNAKIYFYINPEIYNRLKNKQLKIFSALGGPDKFEFFVKPKSAGYIGGEETAALNAIEGKKIEPRFKPPFPTTSGLFGQPTLINNVETFYNVALVERGEFYDFRFYTINGPVPKAGVYSYPAKWTVKMVLDESKNYPAFPFFVQVGGDAAGEVLASGDLDRLVPGAASITVHNLNKTVPEKLLRYWLNFFRKNSCGQCTPCREGTYRLLEILDKKPVAWPVFLDLLAALETTSFCALGCSVPAPVKSYVRNILNNDIKKLINN